MLTNKVNAPSFEAGKEKCVALVKTIKFKKEFEETLKFAFV